jgi:hypothetical protein
MLVNKGLTLKQQGLADKKDVIARIVAADFREIAAVFRKSTRWQQQRIQRG